MGRTTRDTEAILSIDRAAELLKCSKRHVWRLAKNGYLEKMGHGVSYASVTTLMSARRESTCMTPTEMSIRLNDLERRVAWIERSHKYTVRDRVITPSQSMEVRSELKKLHPGVIS